MPSSKQNLLAQRARSDTKLDDFLLSGGLQLRVSLNDGTYSAVTPSRNLSFSLPYPLDFSWSKAFPKPPKPSNEEMRVQAVKKLNIRKNDAALCENKRFERLCDMACAAMSASYAQINLIDHEKSYSIQSRGFRPAVRIIPREESAGAHTLMYNEPLVIGDLRNDSRFSHHRICKDDDVRFFASFQICGPDRLVIGTFDIAHTLAKTGVSDATIEIVNKITRFIAEEIFKTCGGNSSGTECVFSTSNPLGGCGNTGSESF